MPMPSPRPADALPRFAFSAWLASARRARPARAFAAFAAKGTEDEPFTETVDVRVINVEAVVEDADGNRVQGLGIGDFEILVDGKPQPAEYFSEIRGNIATPAAGGGRSARRRRRPGAATWSRRRRPARRPPT